MAIINIQEILHPSDSDAIKFEKINYNFDQIVVAGGGPKGPIGPKGEAGEDGPEGQIGPQGSKGEKGEDGSTTSPWKTISIDLDPADGKNDYTFLKPKVSTDINSTIVWLGDSSFNEASNDGDVALRSTLNVGRHYNFDTSSIVAGYMTLYHSATRKLELTSEDDASGHVQFNFNALTDNPLDPLPDIRLNFNNHVSFAGAVKFNNFDITGVLPQEDGMIRYNQGGAQFEGYIGGQWLEFCMAPCGTGGGAATISITPSGNITVNADGTPQTAFAFGDWNGSIAVDASGTIAITAGNGATVTTTQANFPANTTPGTNTLTVDVNVTVPTGYSNASSIVTGQVTVTQPTSYVTTTTAAPTTTTAPTTLAQFNCNTSGLVVSVLDGTVGNNVQSLVTWNGNPISPVATQPIQYAAGNNSYDLSFTVPAGFNNSGQSYTCSDTANATQTFNGTYNVNYGPSGQTGGEVCTGAVGTPSINNLAVSITQANAPTTAQWRAAASTAAALHLYNNSLLPQNYYFSVTSITDHNGQAVTPDGKYHEMEVNGTIGDSTDCPPPATYHFEFLTPPGAMPATISGNSSVGANFIWHVSGDPNTAGPSLSSSDFSVQNPLMYGSSSIGNYFQNAMPGVSPGFVEADLVSTNGQITATQNLTIDFNAYSSQLDSSSVTSIGFSWAPCIVYGEPILMADGSLKLVEDIVEGDVLAARSISGLALEENAWHTWSTTDFSSTSSTTVVTAAIHGSYDKYHVLEFSAGDDLKITHEHPVLSRRGGESGVVEFRKVESLIANLDEVYNNELGWVTLNANNVVEETVQTVALDAEDADNYVARGIVVHNNITAK